MKKYILRNINNCEEKYKKIIYDKMEDLELIFYIKPFLNNLKENELPQFIFLFSDLCLIGYLFLMKDNHSNYNDHSWLACHNADELQIDEALMLLEEGIKVCTICGAKKLRQYLISDVDFYLQQKNSMHLK